MPMGRPAANLTPRLSSSLIPTASAAVVCVGRRRVRSFRRGRFAPGVAVAYIERNPNSLTALASKVIGSLPVVGLLVRIFSEEGGIGDDLIDFAEFRRRVGKKCSVIDSRAFVEFKERRGPAGDPFHVLLCCWLVAIGAGLLKSEEIFEGVARLRISNDIEFEEETFLDAMRTAKQIERADSVRACEKGKAEVCCSGNSMVVLVEKAVEAIYVCCFGKDPIEEEDVRLLCVMLNAVFPSVERAEIEERVNSIASQIAEGQRPSFSELKPLSKEAMQRQMNELELLNQRSKEITDTSSFMLCIILTLFKEDVYYVFGCAY
ncbi:hypothetical protein HPP92_024318 [Vanilla planifolia]|uniref:Uncharacterized protein n=1 Tax=Vanilla planifolia TaxID=51239 RepID=A0A835PMP1_VANPL|nr:hypothetical protein HPP92_024318 [Vanilla planifolia]